MSGAAGVERETRAAGIRMATAIVFHARFCGKRTKYRAKHNALGMMRPQRRIPPVVAEKNRCDAR